MINARLKRICNLVSEWCDDHGVPVDIACDEEDLQGLLLLHRHRHWAGRLLDFVGPAAAEAGVHVRAHPVRAGTVLAFSLRSLSESELGRRLQGGQVKDFASRIDTAFLGTPVQPEALPPPVSLGDALRASVLELTEGGQYKGPTDASRRAQSTNRLPKRFGSDDATEPMPVPLRSRRRKLLLAAGERPQAAIAREARFDQKLNGVFCELDQPGQSLPMPGDADGLKGMGAEFQPDDLFKRFSAAMSHLGQQLRIGSLQDLLKQQGIMWKLSEDGQALIFYIQNATTKAPQPIARVGYQTLGKPQEFQTQLLSMVDFAKGQAPGTEQQKYEEAQDAQKMVRDAATQFAPPDPSKQQAQQQVSASPTVPGGAGTPAPAPAQPAKPAAPAAKLAGPPGKPAAGAHAKPTTKPVNQKVGKLAAQARRPKVSDVGTPGVK